jgi:hypothetical protein
MRDCTITDRIVMGSSVAPTLRTPLWTYSTIAAYDPEFNR